MKKVFIAIIVSVCLAAAGYYINSTIDYTSFNTEQFPSGTYINGIDCSNMTVDEAEDALTEYWNSHRITFTSHPHTLGSISMSGISYDIHEQLIRIRENYVFAVLMNDLLGTDLNMNIKMNVDEYGDQFVESIEYAQFHKEDSITETQDAYIDLNDPELTIVDEVYGNNLDCEFLKEKLGLLIADGKFSIHYINSEFYKQPSITAESEELLERQNFYRKYLTSNVTYTLGEDTIKITPSEIASFRGLELKANGILTNAEKNSIKQAVSDNILLEDKISEYVSTFAEKYNTLYSVRNFVTSSGDTVTIVGGDYGFALDQESEKTQLIKDLSGRETVQRDPVWAIRGFTEYQIGNDIGNTYVEVSIKDQHLWYYKDGKKIVECDIVTGNPYMGYSTPTGTFGLTYKQLGATLRGENADGTEYESPVTYWMPFYGNYGLHDATWRYAFGGNIYLGGGSHGCVNMPYEAAQKVFENIADSNVPVVVYDR